MACRPTPIETLYSTSTSHSIATQVTSSAVIATSSYISTSTSSTCVTPTNRNNVFAAVPTEPPRQYGKRAIKAHPAQKALPDKAHDRVPHIPAEIYHDKRQFKNPVSALLNGGDDCTWEEIYMVNTHYYTTTTWSTWTATQTVPIAVVVPTQTVFQTCAPESSSSTASTVSSMTQLAVKTSASTSTTTSQTLSSTSLIGNPSLSSSATSTSSPPSTLAMGPGLSSFATSLAGNSIPYAAILSSNTGPAPPRMSLTTGIGAPAGASPNPSGSGTPGAADKSKDQGSSNSSASTAGAVVGGILGLLGLMAFTLFVIRTIMRKKRLERTEALRSSWFYGGDVDIPEDDYDDKSPAPMQSRFSAPSFASNRNSNRMSIGGMAFLSNPLNHIHRASSRFPQLGTMKHALRNSFMPSHTRPDSHGWGNSPQLGQMQPDMSSPYPGITRSRQNQPRSILRTSEYGDIGRDSMYSTMTGVTAPPPPVPAKSQWRYQQESQSPGNQGDLITINTSTPPRNPSPIFDFTASPTDVRGDSAYEDRLSLGMSIAGMITFPEATHSSPGKTTALIDPSGFPMPPERRPSYISSPGGATGGGRNLLPALVPTTPLFEMPAANASSVFEYANYSEENGDGRASLATTRTALSEDRKTRNWYDKPLWDRGAAGDSALEGVGMSLYGGIEREQGGSGIATGRARSVKSVRWEQFDAPEVEGIEPLPGRKGGMAV